MYDSLIRHLRYFQYVTHCHATTEKCAACQYKGNVCGMAEYTRHEILGVAADAITALQSENAKKDREIASREQASIDEHAETHYWRDKARAAESALSRVEAERDAALKRLKKIDELCIAFRDAGSSGLADMFARDIMELSGPQGEA